MTNAEIGRSLQQARLERNLSLEQVSKETHIRLAYLQALEDGEFERLPSPVQARGFLRTYANFLGIDAQPLLAAMNGVKITPLKNERPLKAQEKRPPDLPATEANAIFVEIGQSLRTQREILGLSLEDIERQTRLRTHYLKALEAGELDALPSPVQGRGMLNNYATFLGLDPEPLLLRFAEGLNARLAAKQATRPRSSIAKTRQHTLPSRIGLPIEFLFIGVLTLILVGFVIWGIGRINRLSTTTEVTPSIPSVAEALMMSPETTVSITPMLSETPEVNVSSKAGLEETAVSGLESAGEVSGNEMVSTEALSTLALPSGAIQVSVIVRQRAWVRVIVDGEVQLEGRVIPGSTYDFAGEEQIELLTGNGAALQVMYNQQDLGMLGVYGEVAHRIFTPKEVLLPTPTPTPTGQPQPLSSPTPQPTSTVLSTPAP